MRIRLALVLLVTLVSLGWVLWGMDLGRSLSALGTYQVGYLIGPFLIFLITLYMRAARFEALLDDRTVPFGSMLGIVAVSFLAINVVPLRMGELVRPYMLVEKHGVSFGSGVAAVVLERLLDMLAMLCLLGAVAVVVDLPQGGLVVFGIDLLSAGLRVLGGTAVVLLVGALIAAVVGRPAVELAIRVMRPFSRGLADRVGGLGYHFVDGMRTLGREPLRLVRAVLHTAGIWLLTLVAVWLTMRGFPALSPDLDMVLFNWGATMCGMVLFPTPGFFGPFEAASAGSLRVLGVGTDLAGLFALVMHAVMFGFTVASGAFFVVREGWSLVHLVRASRGAEPIVTSIETE